MALVLLRLRLAIARRGRRRGRSGKYFVFSWIVGIGFGLLAAATTATLAAAGGSADLLLLTLYCSLLAPWLIGPITEPTLADGVVDPARLEQFPLTTWQQVSGLVAGALVSPTAAFTFLFAVGPAFAVPMPPGARIVALLGAMTFTVLCVALSRAAQALLASALRSRRGTDLSAIAASVVVLLFYIGAQQTQAIVNTFTGRDATGPLGIALGWLPPGAAGSSVIFARDGDWFASALRLTAPLLTIALACLAWQWALARRVDGNGNQRRIRKQQHLSRLSLIPRPLRGRPQGPSLAAASQQLRYFFFRSPRALQTLIVPPVAGILIAQTSFAGQSLNAQLCAFAAMTAATGSFNVFGYDGAGFGYLVLGGAPLRQVLLGKVLVPLIYLIPLLTGYGLVSAALRGFGWYDLLVALMAGCCVYGLGVGIGSLASVLNPSDQSQVRQQQGSFPKVFGWFATFFTAVAGGSLLWWAVEPYLGGLGTAVVFLAATTLAARVLLDWSGRRLERDPEPILNKLEARAG